MQYLIHSHSPEETRQIGQQFAQLWLPGTVLALRGDLGAGKTTWTRGLIEGLGLDTRAYSSPTFTICHSYRPQPGQLGRISCLHHLDVYRLSGPEEFHSAGLQEILDTEGNCVLEWAERIAELLPATCLELRIERVAEREEDSLETVVTQNSNQADWLHLVGSTPLDLEALLGTSGMRKMILTVPAETESVWRTRGVDPRQFGYVLESSDTKAGDGSGERRLG